MSTAIESSFRVAVESVIEYQGTVLLTKRATNCAVAPGVWNVPAGKVKLLEVTSDAVKRETEEETGVEVKIVRLLAERATVIKSNGQPAYRNIFTYQTNPVDSHFKVVLNNEHSEYRWVSSKDLDDKEFSSLLPELREIIKRVLK